MEINEFAPWLKSASGKLTGISDWWIVRRYKKFFTGHKNKKRNYRDNPVTKEEQKTRDRMAQVVADYKAIDHTSQEWRDLVKEFQAQCKKKKGIHSNVYAYFVHREMDKLKTEGALAADPSKNKQDWSLKKRK